MDKYINMLFIQLSQKYKINIITIMSYNKEYGRISRLYKFVIDKKDENSIFPEFRESIEIRGKQSLIQEMMKWL